MLCHAMPFYSNRFYSFEAFWLQKQRYLIEVVAGDTQLFLKHDPSAMGWRIGDHVGLLVSNKNIFHHSFTYRDLISESFEFHLFGALIRQAFHLTGVPWYPYVSLMSCPKKHGDPGWPPPPAECHLSTESWTSVPWQVGSSTVELTTYFWLPNNHQHFGSEIGLASYFGGYFGAQLVQLWLPGPATVWRLDLHNATGGAGTALFGRTRGSQYLGVYWSTDIYCGKYK